MTHDFRRIEIVRDVDADDYYFADAILDRLSGQEISDLKTELLQRKESDRPKYRCPHCSTPLFVRYRPVHAVNGKDALFYHHAEPEKGCPWKNDVGQNPSDVNALKFNGRQEGERHKSLKTALYEAVCNDKTFEKTDNDKRAIYKDGKWRKPDVSATRNDQMVAFDVQLATTHLQDIRGREEFYKKHGISYVWILDADEETLRKASFQYIYWANDGQFFTFDDKAKKVSTETSELHLTGVYADRTFVPNGLGIKWRKETIPVSKIIWETENLRPKLPIPSFNERAEEFVNRHFFDDRKHFINKLREDPHLNADIRELEGYWDSMAAQLNASQWRTLYQEKAIDKVLSKLFSIAAGKIIHTTKLTNLIAVMNSLLQLRSSGWWLPLIERVCTAYGEEQQSLLRHPPFIKQLNEKRKESRQNCEVECGDMFEVIFPKIAFSRASINDDDVME